MARIVCIWEHGAALGHLSSLRPFMERAVRDGHEVTLVTREMQNVPTVLGELPVRLLQTPAVLLPAVTNTKPTLSVGMLLASIYRSPEILLILYRAWQDIFNLLSPDLVVYDHSPTALIASLGQHWKKWIIGSGFLIPRTDQEVFGILPSPKPLTDADLQLVSETDIALVKMINGQLGKMYQSQISGLMDIWDQADLKWLLTIPELDHFGARPATEYLGVPDNNIGGLATWPDRPRMKIMGYVSECEALEPMLDILNQQKINGLFYSRDISPERAARFPNLTFSSKPLRLPELLKDADLMINTGSHKTVLQTWLTGVPQLMFASHQEQLILARRVSSYRRGVTASAASKDVLKPLQVAFALAKASRFPVDSELSQEMLGQRLQRHIDAEFEKLRML